MLTLQALGNRPIISFILWTTDPFTFHCTHPSSHTRLWPDSDQSSRISTAVASSSAYNLCTGSYTCDAASSDTTTALFQQYSVFSRAHRHYTTCRTFHPGL